MKKLLLISVLSISFCYSQNNLADRQIPADTKVISNQDLRDFIHKTITNNTPAKY